MKFTQSAVLAFAATAIAAPSPTEKEAPRPAAPGCSSAVTLDASTNVFKKYTLHPNKFYREEVEAAVKAVSDPSLASAAAKVADVGSFLWIDTIANIAKIDPAVSDMTCDHILGLVIYDLPGRDCAAKASNGELKVGEISRYKTEYIDRKSTDPLPAPSSSAGNVTMLNCARSYCQAHQAVLQRCFRAPHRARFAAQPCHQLGQGCLQELGQRLP